ncbi:marginal zone B- and B1-cell-specific protein isoform X1 [Lathamus discolor]|uniref:marginal zone B- and B1-cell-specific protein isoform X1 n=1 Tax=Lathamus discolor TaxID=678569 RepID=UPI0032B876FD
MHQCPGGYIGPAPPPGTIAPRQDAAGAPGADPEPADGDRRGGDVRGPPRRPGPLHPCPAAQRRGAALAPHARVPALRRLPRHRLPEQPFGASELPCSWTRRPHAKIEKQLSRAEGKVGKKVLSESDYMEVLERSCSQGWESYGVQELDGEKRLAGPGLSVQEPMSVMVTGGPWPGRLSKMCHGAVGERGEAQVYGAHRRGPAALRELLCHGDKGPCAGGKAGGAPPPKALQNEL